ncbi:hypothetical protein DPMN_020186 [Dreissena polymorpha]|uniref:Uncharacterized protein n=1 Tax=Dreissena polymorpha TaxID=45954 RepID=A0A9D4NID1_DREPO|nr:hypothetical protein DPMN_020186 [Dreissena polymorpha]
MLEYHPKTSPDLSNQENCPHPPGSHVRRNVLTKFHENWEKNLTSRVFTCFNYIHIEKNAPPTGGHVFSPIWTIFELIRHIKKTMITAPPTGGHLHEDWALNVTSTVFKLDGDIIKTNLLIKFHEDRK